MISWFRIMHPLANNYFQLGVKYIVIEPWSKPATQPFDILYVFEFRIVFTYCFSWFLGKTKRLVAEDQKTSWRWDQQQKQEFRTLQLYIVPLSFSSLCYTNSHLSSFLFRQNFLYIKIFIFLLSFELTLLSCSTWCKEGYE